MSQRLPCFRAPGRPLALLLVLMAACGADTEGPPPQSPAPGRAGTGGATSVPVDTAADAASAGDARGRDEPEAASDAAPDDTAVDGVPAAFRLESDGFYRRGDDLMFYASACYPRDQSPPFRFVGVPAGAKSLAFTFVDRNIGATKWVIWDIPPGTPGLPVNLSKTVHPTELPSASQRGSLGRTGYSGPGVAGPPLRSYDFVVYALDVAELPGTDGASTTALRSEIIARHVIGKSAPLTAKGQLGGAGQ